MKKIESREEMISSLFRKYVPPEIKETDRKETIELLKSYMPTQQESTIVSMKKLVWKTSIDTQSHFKIQLFILTFLMFAVYTIIPGTMDRWIIFVFTVPAPIFLMGWHLMNAQTKDMVELESTFKYSFQQILFSKFVAITICSILIYSCSLLYIILIQREEMSIALFHIVVSGLTPILLFSLILLYLSTTFRGVLSWTVILLAWIFFILLSIYTPMGIMILSMNVIIYIIVDVMLMTLFIHRLSNFWRMESSLNEFY